MRACFFGLILTAVSWCESTPHEALLVLSKGDHTLAIVDPATGKVVAKAPSGEDPHEVVASDDGKFAYISNYGGGAYNTLTVIDLVGQKSARKIDLGALRGPHGLHYAGGKVWFTAEAAKAIGSYDPAKGVIDWIMGTGQDRTHMIIVTPDLKRIFTSNVSSASISILEKSTRPPGGGPGQNDKKGPPPGGGGPRGPMGPPGGNWEQTVIAVGRGAEGFDASPNAKELWAANAQDGTISIVDLASKKVTATLQANVPGANRLKFTPDGKLVFVTSLSGSGVAIFDAATHKEVKRILKENRAAGIQMQPDGSRVYLACTGDNYVAVVSLKTLEVTGKIDAGPEPDGLAWSVLK
jgi:DNA-binding beta-propeller fold protein YncE